MKTAIEESGGRGSRATISEAELKRVCEQIYNDRKEIFSFNPAAGKRGALLWMLLGCLISLLGIEDRELESIIEPSSRDPYGDAVRAILKDRARPPFDPGPLLDQLTKSVDDV